MFLLVGSCIARRKRVDQSINSVVDRSDDSASFMFDIFYKLKFFTVTFVNFNPHVPDISEKQDYFFRNFIHIWTKVHPNNSKKLKNSNVKLCA